MTDLTWEEIQKFEEEVYASYPELKDTPCIMVSLPHFIKEGVGVVALNFPNSELTLKTSLKLFAGEIFVINLETGDIIAVTREARMEEVLHLENT